MKLEKALQVFETSVADKLTIDIGASTGGFTDVMLQSGGAFSLRSKDVGTNQLVWKLRQDLNRVRSMEQYNFRYAQKRRFQGGTA